MLFYYLLIFIASVILSAFFTFFTVILAHNLGITDKPDSERKIHQAETPLLGGLAIFLSFFIMLYFVHDRLLSGNLEPHHWIGVFAGAAFLMVGGILDDKYDLKPSRQIIFPLLAIASVIIGGVEIEKITNPLGGYIAITGPQILSSITDFIELLGFKVNNPFGFLDTLSSMGIMSAIFVTIWLLGMMYTTKLLDGLDGLVGGVTAIGAFIIFLFTMTTRYYQPDIGLAALILGGTILGFLFFNRHPARVFLGEGGSLFLGFTLGVLAIISGGKIAIALLVMGLPIMDVAWTIIRRLKEGKNPFQFADRKHLHFRLLDMGLGVKKTVWIFYAFSLFFGLSALFLQSRGKLYALTLLFAIMLGIIIWLEKMDKKMKQP